MEPGQVSRATSDQDKHGIFDGLDSLIIIWLSAFLDLIGVIHLFPPSNRQTIFQLKNLNRIPKKQTLCLVIPWWAILPKYSPSCLGCSIYNHAMPGRAFYEFPL